MPPSTPVATVEEYLYGVQVLDDYRYLEDVTVDSVYKWFRDQSEYARNILDRISIRKDLVARIEELSEGSVHIINVQMVGERIFYLSRRRGAETASLFTRATIDSPEVLLIDAKKIPTDDKQVYTINSYFPSPNGRLVAFACSPGGSEDDTTFIVEVETGRVLPDRIEKCGLHLSWGQDGTSFVYLKLRNQQPNDPPGDKFLDSKPMLHIIGSSQQADTEIESERNSQSLSMERNDFPFLSERQATGGCIATIVRGATLEKRAFISAMPCSSGQAHDWRKIVEWQDGIIDFSIVSDSLLLALSHKSSPNYQLLATSLTVPDFEKATIVMGFANSCIQHFAVSKRAIVVQVLNDGISQVYLVSKSDYTDFKELEFPLVGNISVVSANENSSKILFQIDSWTTASQFLLFDDSTGAFTSVELGTPHKSIGATTLVAKEVSVISRDGMHVPLSIIHQKDILLNNKNPTILEGYGAYGISLLPSYQPISRAWFERGGVYAVAHVRGGGEKGNYWHRDGQKENKPNSWNDFIDCADYLISEGYTSPEYLAGIGESAGGILVGRAMTERPDLFAAIIVRSGSMNALRMEYTENILITPEFGSVKDSVEFTYLLEMDVYCKIKSNTVYPATLVSTGMNDPWVSPWQPGKFAAKLQAVNNPLNPVIFRVDFDGGHTLSTATVTQVHTEYADIYAFVLWQMGHAYLQGKPF